MPGLVQLARRRRGRSRALLSGVGAGPVVSGIDVTEEEDGLALDLWHPMRPGQDRRPFTAAEARAITAELVRAAELVEAEDGESI